jgi:hypothetical protein
MYIEPAGRCAMVETLRRQGARGPWLSILQQVLQLAGPETQFVHHAERAWSSTTYSGAYHLFRLSFSGADAVEAGENFIAALPDHEFTVPGRLVAKATIVSAEHSLIDGPLLALEAELLVLDEA